MRPLHKFVEGAKLDDLPEPSPTIRVDVKSIDGCRFEALLDEAAALRIPVTWPWPKDRWRVTTDVGVVGFEFFDYAEPQARVRCSWAIDLPPGWQPVSEWFFRINDWLESHFSET